VPARSVLEGHTDTAGHIWAYEAALMTSQRLQMPVQDGPGMVHPGSSRTAEMFFRDDLASHPGMCERGLRAEFSRC